MTKRIALIGAAVMATLLALVVLWQFRMVVAYALIALTLAAALRPLMQRLVGRGWVARAAWLLLYLTVLGGLGFLLLQAGDAVIDEVQLLSQTLSEQDRWMLPAWLQGTPLQHAVLARLPTPSQLLEAATGSEGQLVLPTLLGVTQGLGVAVSGVLIVLFLSVYWGAGQVSFERLWLSLLPSDQRTLARGIWQAIEPALGAYVRSQAIQSLLAGLLFSLGFWLLGSPYPTLLALFGAVACLVPVVGAALAVIAPLIVGLLTGMQLSLLTATYALIILIALRMVVRPRLLNYRWHNTILTIVLLVALGDAFGLAGLIVAPLVSLVCQVLWSRLVGRRRVLGAAAQMSDLVERQAQVRALIEAMEEPPPPLVGSSMERLASLIDRAQPLLPAALSDESEALPASPGRGPLDKQHDGHDQAG
jgi:predicted PurR-regulated permease PerM